MLDLLGSNEIDGVGFDLEALSDGTDWGNPESVRRTLRSAIANGSVSVTDSYDNRTIPIRVQVTAGDGVALAAGERALMLATGKRADLTWTSPADLAEPAVFSVVNSDLKFEFNDERDHLERVYTLTLEAEPFTYSAGSVILPAIAMPATSTPTTIDNCSALTGWTAEGATLSVVGGSQIQVAATSSVVRVTRTGVVDFTGKPYLAVVATMAVGRTIGTVEVQSTAGTWTTVPLIRVERGALIYDTSAIPDITVEAVRFTLAATGNTDPGVWATFDTLRNQSTFKAVAAREQVRTLQVPGSAPTPSTLLITSPTDGLGTTMVYTGPDYDPALGWRSTVARTNFANTVSGGFDQIASGSSRTYQLPAADLPPGDYSLWGFLQLGGAGRSGVVTLSAQMADAAGNVFQNTVIASRAVVTAGDGSPVSEAGFYLWNLGIATLPPADLPAGSPVKVSIVLAWTDNNPSGAVPLAVDELLAYNRSLGDLTIVEAGAYPQVWVDAPTLDRDNPAVFLGNTHTAEKSLARPASLSSELRAWSGSHVTAPPITHLHVLTAGTEDTTVSGTLRPAWHTHPMPLPVEGS